MTLEQLEALNELFRQLEDLKKYLRRYQEDRLEVVVRVDGYTEDNKILNEIVKKYTVNIIENLKNEIKRRETALEGISILQSNKII